VSTISLTLASHLPGLLITILKAFLLGSPEKLVVVSTPIIYFLVVSISKISSTIKPKIPQKILAPSSKDHSRVLIKIYSPQTITTITKIAFSLTTGNPKVKVANSIRTSNQPLHRELSLPQTTFR